MLLSIDNLIEENTFKYKFNLIIPKSNEIIQYCEDIIKFDHPYINAKKMNQKSVDKLKIISEIDQYIISQTKETKKTTNYRIQCDISFVLSLISEGLNFYSIERFLAKNNILICSEKSFMKF